MSLEDFIQEILNVRKREFSRLRHLDLVKSEISTDCMGLVYLLMQQQRVIPPSIKLKSRVVDFFNYAIRNQFKTNINQIRKYDLLLWKKESPPTSGDSGHILIVMSAPQEQDSGLYSIKILENSHFSDGPILREVLLNTLGDGSIQGIQWHPKSNKVKRARIIGFKIFKRAVCKRCLFSEITCLCPELPLEKWDPPPFKIIQDTREQKVALRSSRILDLCFKQSNDLYLNNCSERNQFPLSKNSVLVYPHSSSKMLSTQEDFTALKGKQLILLDGSWKQVRAILLGNPNLAKLESIQFKQENSPLYKIRKAPSAQSFSTLESFSFLWKNTYPENRSRALQLETAFKRMIANQIKQMGNETYLKNYSHYPGFES